MYQRAAHEHDKIRRGSGLLRTLSWLPLTFPSGRADMVAVVEEKREWDLTLAVAKAAVERLAALDRRGRVKKDLNDSLTIVSGQRGRSRRSSCGGRDTRWRRAEEPSRPRQRQKRYIVCMASRSEQVVSRPGGFYCGWRGKIVELIAMIPNRSFEIRKKICQNLGSQFKSVRQRQSQHQWENCVLYYSKAELVRNCWILGIL